MFAEYYKKNLKGNDKACTNKKAVRPTHTTTRTANTPNPLFTIHDNE